MGTFDWTPPSPITGIAPVRIFSVGIMGAGGVFKCSPSVMPVGTIDGEVGLELSCEWNAAEGNLMDGTARLVSPSVAVEPVGETAGDCVVGFTLEPSFFDKFSAGASTSIRDGSEPFPSDA